MCVSSQTAVELIDIHEMWYEHAATSTCQYLTIRNIDFVTVRTSKVGSSVIEFYRISKHFIF
jgi:hypothetical protein